MTAIIGLAYLILIMVYAIKNKKIIKTAMRLIKEAEALENYSGEEKLKYCVSRLKTIYGNYKRESGYVALVNTLVDFTNNVNIPEEKKAVNN